MRLFLSRSAFSILVSLLVLSAVGAAPATATDACGTWSNPPTTGNNVKNSRAGTFYATLKSAVEAARAGDTLEIHGHVGGSPGIYAGPVTIDKNLTIQGSQTGNAKNLGSPTLSGIYAAFDTCAEGDSRGWFLVNSGVTFHLKNLMIHGYQKQIYEAIRHRGSGTIDNVAFEGISFAPGPQGASVVVFGSSSSVDVSNSAFVDMGRTGILYSGSGATGTVDGTVFNCDSGGGGGSGIAYGIDVEAGAVVTVQNSSFSNCTGTSGGTKSAAIQATTDYAAGTQLTVTNNQFIHNAIGVAVGFQEHNGNSADTTAATLTGNFFLGNSDAALHVDSTATIQARRNYWGGSENPMTAPDDGIQGLHASNVVTGFNPNIDWHLSGGSLVWDMDPGQSTVFSATFSDPAGAGSNATFTASTGTLSASSVAIDNGKAATTLTLGDTQLPGHTVIEVTVAGSGGPTGSITLASFQSSSSQHDPPPAAQLTNATSSSVTVTNVGYQATFHLYGGTAPGYTSGVTRQCCCDVSIANAQSLGSATRSSNDSSITIDFTPPSDWSGKTIYLQAVNPSGSRCVVTNVESVSN